MARGKKTGGRTKGSKNKINRQVELKKAAERNGATPLEYMLELMRNKKEAKALRAEMAKAAAPYLHARRAPEDAKGKTIPPLLYVTNLPDDET